MNIIFLMISYPDVRINTNMYTDLATEFLKHGHNVYVAAPGGKSTGIIYEGGMCVLRIKTLPLFNTSMIIKGFANVLLPFQYKLAIDRYLGKIRFDLIIAPTPPITFIELARSLKKKSNAKIYLILRDIFPQNARDLGLIKNPLVFWYFKRKEKELYKLADSIGCMSPKNVEYIISHNPGVKVSKLHLLPNWTRVHESKDRLTYAKPIPAVKDKFIAIFGGNFGLPQKIEFLIDVAERLSANNAVLFYLVGAGTELQKIKKLVLDKNLQNVKIQPQLPREDYLELLKQCDVGLVNLSDKFTIPNIPSRTLSYWSHKIPVLAAVDKCTDYGDLLDKCNGGLWSITGDVDAYIANLFYLINNPEKRIEMGKNGYDYLINELNSDKAYSTILSNIEYK